MSIMREKIGLFWLRDDFRLKKNLALYQATKNHEKVVEALIEGGADVHRKDSDGHDALYYAILRGMGNAASMLLTYGATIDMKTVEKCLEYYNFKQIDSGRDKRCLQKF